MNTRNIGTKGTTERQAMRRAQYPGGAPEILSEIEQRAWESKDLALLCALSTLDDEWPASRGKLIPFLNFARVFLGAAIGDKVPIYPERVRTVSDLIAEMFGAGMAHEVREELEIYDGSEGN